MHQQRTLIQYRYLYVQSAQSRIVDPDLNQIRMRPNSRVSGFGSEKVEKVHENEKKVGNFKLQKCWIFSKVWWQDATLFVYFSYFIYNIHSFNRIHTIHLSVTIRRGLSPSYHRL
jgi:hypothetical protein